MRYTPKQLVLAIFVVLVVLASVSFLFSNDPTENVRINPISTSPPKPKIKPTPWIISPEVFRDRPRLLHSRASTIKSDNVHEITERCAQFTQHEQLLDLDCTTIWTNLLKDDDIVAVERMWGFEDTHYGAITLRLNSGIRAMYKPCTSKSEDTTKELIASYIDRLLGFGQTAPVATRAIPISVLNEFMDTTEKQKAFLETVDMCAQEDSYFLGPMIGWWEDLTPVRTVRKYKEPVEVSLENRAVLSENLLTAQMQSKFHAFYLLVNILRHGKDEFITKHGELVSLDLDRSRFKSTSQITGPSINYTWCFTCYMDEWVYNTFQAVGPSQPIDNRLGMLMKEMLSYEHIFQGLWDSRLAVALDTRVEMLLDCVDSCIAKWGRSNVLLNEPLDMTSKELVEYFVLHSEYKKHRNGQQGPSNLDFLNYL